MSEENKKYHVIFEWPQRKVYQLTFSARFGNLLTLHHPASQAPFLSTIMLCLICL